MQTQTQFSLAIDRFASRTEARIEQTIREIGLEVFRRVVMRSPVGNPDLWKGPAPAGYVGGRFKGNWQVAINNIPDGVLELTDPGGVAAMSAATAALVGVRNGEVINIINNLPYAIPLENGWSTQAPEGMVRVTVLEFRDIVRQAATGV